MANMCWNELRLFGDKTFIEGLYKDFVNAEKDGDADGWVGCAVALLTQKGIQVDEGDTKYPFGSDISLGSDEGGTTELTISFETKWAPDVAFTELLVKHLPFTRVLLFAEELGAWGLSETEWNDGVETAHKFSDYVFRTDNEEQVAFYSVPDGHWEIDDEEAEVSVALTLLMDSIEESYEEWFSEFIKQYEEFPLSLVSYPIKPEKPLIIEAVKERIKKFPREDIQQLVAELDETKTDLSEIPKEWLIKLLG